MPSLNTKPIDSTFAIIVFFLESLVFPHCSTSWPWGRSTFTRINFSYTNIHGKKNHWNQNTRNPSPFTNRRWVLTSWTGRKQTHTLKEIQKIITWEHSLWDDRRPRAHPPPTSNNSWGQTDRQTGHKRLTAKGYNSLLWTADSVLISTLEDLVIGLGPESLRVSMGRGEGGGGGREAG